MKVKIKKILLATLVFVLALTTITFTRTTEVQAKINIDEGKMPDGYSVVKKTDQNIAPGIVKTELISNTQKGDMQ